MKRALSVAAMTALSLLVFLFVGYAQEEGAVAVSELLEQELAAMESAFGGLEAFMTELITEVKGNMADIDTFNEKVDDLRDMVEAVAIEIKAAEGKIVGLRTDVTALGEKQQELLFRVVALEAGLSELSAFCDELKSRIDVTGADLDVLRGEFDAWVADYAAFKEEFYAFRDALLADLEEFKAAVYADMDALSTDVYAAIDALSAGVYGDIDSLRDSVYGDLSLLEETLSSALIALEEGLRADMSVLDDTFSADIGQLKAYLEDLMIRVKSLEDEDVGTFKKKVLELERSMAALAIKIDNNRAKLEGFDHAIAGVSEEIAAVRQDVNYQLSEFDSRLIVVEDNAQLETIQAQIDSLYFISIVALLAGVGALIWGFLGQ